MPEHKALSQQLLQQGIVNAAQAQQLQQPHSPWWLQLLLGTAAWVAALMIVGAFITPLVTLADSNLIRSIVGTALLAAAIWLALQQQEFLQHMAVAIALAGQGLLVFVFYDASGSDDNLARYACIAISAVLLLSPLPPLHQRVSLSLALLSLLSLLNAATALVLAGSVLASAAVVGWCSRPTWATLRFARSIQSLLEVSTLAALGLALLAQSPLFTELQPNFIAQLPFARALYSAFAAFLLLSCVFWLSRLATLPSRLLMLTFTLLLCLALYPAIGLLLSAALMLACFYGCSKTGYLLCLFCMLLALSQYYYDLQINLLHKSALLALSGLILLLAWMLLQRYQRRLA
jgi:uncharacterized membrane protein YozB (DUF420 family)